MSFCGHCEGQRFDRSRALHALRSTRQRLRRQDAACTADQALTLAIEAVRALDIPHLESADDWSDDDMVH